MTEDELELQEAWEGIKRFYRDNWLWIMVGLWLVYVLWIIWARMSQIDGLALSDTDDNLRLAQVRAWLDGQSWYDLRQHRFDPLHGGANIHWSRLVDLPIAGLIVLLRPMLGQFGAEQWAVAIAPMIPLLLLTFSLGLVMRRLVSEGTWILPMIAVLSAYSTIGMFTPLRIDHHGWQLAFLALALAGMADPKRARGGALMGLATGLSLAVGLEMLIYLALLGGAAVLLWVAERDERRRLASYAAALVASTGAGFLIFASNDNWLAVCDALSPVWLSDAAVGGAVMLGLAMLKLDNWKSRLAAAAAAGVVVAAFHALAWPHCLQRLEGVSAEASQLWLDRVREARPFYRFSWRIATISIGLPLIGLLGWGLLLGRAWRRGEEARDLLRRTAAVALPALAALGLLFWQMRAAPAAQMLAIPAATALAAFFGGTLLNADEKWKRILGVVGVTFALGALLPVVINAIPSEKDSPSKAKVSAANRACPTLEAMAAVNRQPKGMVFSFIDLGPRLITVTHHDAVGGPYHRNYPAIVNVMKAFRGDATQARRIIDYYGSDYVLICPDMATATIFMAETPKGFYAEIAGGKVPDWLKPIDLGPDSPFKMWKVVR